MRKFIQGLCVCLLALGGVAIAASPASADIDLGPVCIQQANGQTPSAVSLNDGQPTIPDGGACEPLSEPIPIPPL